MIQVPSGVIGESKGILARLEGSRKAPLRIRRLRHELGSEKCVKSYPGEGYDRRKENAHAHFPTKTKTKTKQTTTKKPI